MDLNDKEVRRSLVDSTTQILVDYNFDGLGKRLKFIIGFQTVFINLLVKI